MMGAKQLPLRLELISANTLCCSFTICIPPYSHATFGNWFARSQKVSSAPGRIQSSSKKARYLPLATAGKRLPESLTTISSNPIDVILFQDTLNRAGTC